jgi:cation diffusion facilitator CzcD-associated flavoprotein CzcO
MEGHDEKLPEPEAAISPYLRQALVVDHVKAKAAKHTSKIVLNTSVERVRKSTSGKWQVVLREEVGEDQEKWYSEEFDGVVVATGHNSVPRIPPIPGLRNWQGKLLHSISYRDAQSFANQVRGP